MKSDVTVIIPTFGDDPVWRQMAFRAAASAANQTYEPQEIVRVHHADSLHEARNAGAAQAETEWLIFLDADDELDPRYVEAMFAKDHGDIRRPATLGVVEDVEDDEPVMIEAKDLLHTNYIIIGAMCRRDQFMAVGGFNDYPVLEDWDLWLRMVHNGSEVVDVPDAIYRVHVRPGSRNQDVAQHGKIYSKIRRQYR